MRDWQAFFTDTYEGKPMPLQEMGLSEVANQGATAGGLGLLGRLVALSVASKRPTGWSLLWELPLALGMGVVGKGIAESMQTTGFMHYAVIIGISYTGPRILDILTQRYLDKSMNKRDPAKTSTPPKKD